MPLDTDFNVFPYFDDFSEDKEFYAIAYKPKISVQARELNQMQSILRHQIEKFGDSIFQVGTIIDGCNFNFLPTYPYAKIRDVDVTGLNVTPDAYLGLFTMNSANLQAIIIDSAVGFESTPPDLNTIYLSYRNAGSDGNTFQYSPGDMLTVFDSNTGIWAVTVNNAGVGFANSDKTVFVSALAVNVTTGTFSNGDYVSQPSTGANLQIINIDSSSLATAGQVVLTLKPRTADLSNASSNGSAWAVANNDTIRNAGNTAVGSVMAVFGAGASAAVSTDGSGRVQSIAMQARGFGYTFLPTVTIKSANNGTGVAALSLVAQNYVTKVTIANTVDSVGNGYAFSVSDGTIYQKGLFLKVDAQTIIVDKYDVTPNNVSVGFKSAEQIITSDIDQSLEDNANGFPNAQAPGADRLKVTPELVLFGADTSDPNILPIVSWSEGNPYRQNQTTSYSAIGDKMAQELYETEGDFVISRFNVTSRSPFTMANEGTKVSIITNPGSAYIKGQRVFNETNYTTDIFKTTDTSTSNNRYITLNYGNWIRVNEVGGVFQFSTGDTVTFYDTARKFISGTTASNTTPNGTALGTARVRSLTHENGIPGDANSSYRMYLFDITLNQGVNFRDLRSVGYSGTYTGIADIVLTPDATTNANIAKLANTDFDYLLFDTGAATLKNATNVTYTYRTIDQTLTTANTGLITKNISSTPSETFPYTGALTASQLQDLYVVPVGNSLIAFANATGSANATNTSNLITGNSSTWLNDLFPGDYIQLFQNSTVSDVRRVISVANNTSVQLDANVAYTGSNLGVYRYFPKNAAIPLGLRSGLSANVSANQQLLTVSLGMALQGSGTVNTAIAVNITRSNVAPATKTAARDQMVKLQLSNNSGRTSGPWALGVSDIFRLKRVFVDVANTVSNTSTEVTNYFYIDHKQNEDYLDLGYLYLKPNAGLSLSSSQFLLVQFDAFQATGTGYFDTVSYTGANATTIATTDSTPLANLGSSVSSWEIPECFGSRGQYFDLMKFFDFRPIAANSTTASANSQTAPVNPAYVLSFGNTADPTNDKKFPLPDSALLYNMEQYMYRTDAVFADKNGKIGVVRGNPSSKIGPTAPSVPGNSIRLVNVFLPPYPCLPTVTAPMQTEIITTRIACQNYLFQRVANKTITIPSAPGTPYDTQPQRYTMASVGTLDRRISALEYYNTLNSLQSDMVNRIIPSSNDPSISRFKFGVFVDAFDSAISQDVTNPSYAAAISGSNMTPPLVNWVLPYGNAKSAAQPYIDFKLISQPDATQHFTVVPTPNTPSPTPPAPSLVANTWLVRTDHLAPSQSAQIVLTDYAYPQFANQSGQATLFFYVNPTVTPLSGSLVIDPDNFQVYQGSTLIADAYTSATALSAADVALLISGAVPANWFNGLPINGGLSRPAVGWVNGSGRLDWTHNPAGGNQYTIVSTRQSLYDHWRWALRYPSAFGAQIVASPSSGVSTYVGHMDVEPSTLLLAMQTPTSTIPSLQWAAIPNSSSIGISATGSDYTSLGNNLLNYYNNDLSGANSTDVMSKSGSSASAAVATTTEVPQAFGMLVYGLKPNTNHTLTINGINKTSRIFNLMTGQTGVLTTDGNGMLNFIYYFDGLGADQDVSFQYVAGPGAVGNGGTKAWATEVAASMAQPLSMGNISVVVSAPGSSASFPLAVVADADMVLSTVTGTNTQAALLIQAWQLQTQTQNQNQWGGASYGSS